MEYTTLIARLKTASESFKNLEMQLADPDIANNPKKLESIARERAKLEPLVSDFNQLIDTNKEIEDSKKLLKDSRNDKDMESLINEELINLEEFKNIVPCGIKDSGITSLHKLNKNVSFEELDNSLKKYFEKIFGENGSFFIK